MRIVAKAEGVPEKVCQVDGKDMEIELSGDPNAEEFLKKISEFDLKTLKYSSPEKGAWWNAVCTLEK